MHQRDATRVVVIGGGMAGLSLGFELAQDHVVVVLEAETLPAKHSTGRSAALYFTDYGPAPVRQVTRASLPLFAELQETLATPELLTPRGALLVATDPLAAQALDDWARDSRLRAVSSTECAQLCPALKLDQVVRGRYDASACDIDVMALHDAYARGLRSRGGRLAFGARVAAAERTAHGWRVHADDARSWDTDVVVNAAGAWGDQVWATFGVPGHGLVPCRRTVALARTATQVDGRWPAVGDAAESWYFKPEGGGVLVSPSDETASVPRDEQPDALDVARALDSVNEVTTLDLRSVSATWAGQRTFAPDRLPVVGAHPADDSLFSFVGQGGYGIQMAPALARAAAQLLRGTCAGSPLFDVSAFSPTRDAVRADAVARPASANVRAPDDVRLPASSVAP